MKTSFGVIYAISKSQQTKIEIDIEVTSYPDRVLISLTSTSKHRDFQSAGLLIDGAEIDSDGVIYRIEDLVNKYIKPFEIPELIYNQTREELTRRIMEFLDVQRNIRSKKIKAANNIIDGQQLHHKAYLEADQ